MWASAPTAHFETAPPCSSEEAGPCAGQEQHGQDREIGGAFQDREEAALPLQLEGHGDDGEPGEAQGDPVVNGAVPSEDRISGDPLDEDTWRSVKKDGYSITLPKALEENDNINEDDPDFEKIGFFVCDTAAVYISKSELNTNCSASFMASWTLALKPSRKTLPSNEYSRIKSLSFSSRSPVP